MMPMVDGTAMVVCYPSCRTGGRKGLMAEKRGKWSERSRGNNAVTCECGFQCEPCFQAFSLLLLLLMLLLVSPPPLFLILFRRLFFFFFVVLLLLLRDIQTKGKHIFIILSLCSLLVMSMPSIPFLCARYIPHKFSLIYRICNRFFVCFSFYFY